MDPKGELQVEHKRSEAWKQEVLENFEERIQLRRALLDGENAVRELLVDRGKAQVAISQWETDGPPVDTNNAGTSEETKTPRSIQQWNQNLRSVQTKLAHAAQTNEDLKARLADNMRTLHNLESSLPHRVKNNDLRACPFAGPQHPSTYTLNYH